ncbi:Phosphonoacetaldehyde hydrolase [Gossypium australe]|uniref:Phosphonoacetaldehyde hydrolase n=1 Tax=Gossypium australe TaxID=47621 RepID=A0A5B6VVD1_9ROSI|nr:Phosphonoacetaldehyde hydrolase [Gossypium australe]
MYASVRPCLGHGIGVDMCASVRPCLGHGIGVDMWASVRPCLGHGIGIDMCASKTMSGTWHRPRYVSQCKTMSGTWHRHFILLYEACRVSFGIPTGSTGNIKLESK